MKSKELTREIAGTASDGEVKTGEVESAGGAESVGGAETTRGAEIGEQSRKQAV